LLPLLPADITILDRGGLLRLRQLASSPRIGW